MEDIYTIKVKTKPDTRNLYPSERRYSASTVSGLAWVHIALAATSFLLACLALVNPNSDIKRLTLNDTEQKQISKNELLFNLTEYSEIDNNETEFENFNATTENAKSDSNYILVLAPTLLTVFALAAGTASIMASVRWYIDRNITWLFIMSILSTISAFVSILMIAAWFITTSEDTEFYKDGVLNDFFVFKHSDVIAKNDSHLVIARNTRTEESTSFLITKRVVAINILIASILELLWSILSVKISYKGMKNTYKEDNNERRGNCISVVTTIKGNNTKKLPRNTKLIPPKPDLIEHYPSAKIKRIFLAQSDNGFYLKNQNNKAKLNTETSSEFYKERMMNFLNRCASLEGISTSEMRTPSVQSETVNLPENTLNPIPEVTSVEINSEPNSDPETPEVKDRMTPVSWGDTPDHTIYNQNTLNLEKIFSFEKKNEEMEGKERTEKEVKTEDCVGRVLNISEIGTKSQSPVGLDA